MTLRMFGLDGEMSGANIADGDRLIQIGVTAHLNPDGSIAPGKEVFSSLINPGEMHWVARAEAVHGFTRKQIESAPPASEVDLALRQWLIEHGADSTSRGGNFMTGFNVGTFDMPFLALTLPLSAAIFTRRTADLNAMCLGLDGATYLNDPNPLDWSTWKSLAVTYAERTIATLFDGEELEAHDAGYDALLHLHVWRFLRARMHGTPLVLPQNVVLPPESKVMAIALLQKFGKEKASVISGIPEDFIIGWSKGGHATNSDLIAKLRSTYHDMSSISFS